MAKKKTVRQPDAPQGFTLRERLIFSYSNGTKTVRADPIELLQSLLSYPELNFERDMAALQLPNTPAAQESYGIFVKAIQDVFKVKPFEDLDNGKSSGLTKAEMFDLLRAFLEFLESFKKKRGIFPTPSQTTAGMSSANGSATPPSSGSGSTKTEASTENPSPSPSAPVLP